MRSLKGGGVATVWQSRHERSVERCAAARIAAPSPGVRTAHIRDRRIAGEWRPVAGAVHDRCARSQRACFLSGDKQLANGPQPPLRMMRPQLRPKLDAADAAPAKTRGADIANQPPIAGRDTRAAAAFAASDIDDFKRADERHRHDIGTWRTQRTSKPAAVTQERTVSPCSTARCARSACARSPARSPATARNSGADPRWSGTPAPGRARSARARRRCIR